MNSKVFVGGIIGAVVAFLAGWVIYGMLLMDYLNSNMIHYEGLVKAEPELWLIFLGGLAWALLTSYVIHGRGIITATQGALCGAILYGLIAAGVDLLLYAQMNLSNINSIVVDILASIVMGGFVGASIGWWMGRGKPVIA